MICLTEQEMRKRLNLPGSSVSFDESLYPFFTNPEADCFGIDIPSRGLTFPSLARALSLLEAKDEAYFHGAFLWYKLWEIGSPQLDKIGWAVVEKMRLGFGEPRPLEVAPVQRFREDESTQLQAFLLQALVFRWDANLLHNILDRFVHVSHDGFIVVAGQTKAVRDECWFALERFGPKAASDQVRSLFLYPHTSATG